MTHARKPRIFLASSSRDEKLMDDLAGLLAHRAEASPWTHESREDLGLDILGQLLEKARSCEFGVFVITRDSRWGRKPNGNVMLELGLFIGRLGPRRSFILKERGLALPADLRGRILADFDLDAWRQSGPAALRDASQRILTTLDKVSGEFVSRLRGLWLETKAVGPAETPYTLVQFDAMADEPVIRGLAFDRDGQVFASWPDHVADCLVSAASREVFQMFDASVGSHHTARALGVNRFRFTQDLRAGEGSYIVHGGGGIQTGIVDFRLERVTPAWLRRVGLAKAPGSLDDEAACGSFVRALLASGHAGRNAAPDDPAAQDAQDAQDG